MNETERKQICFTAGEFLGLIEMLTQIRDNHKDDDLGLCFLRIDDETGDYQAIVTLFEYNGNNPEGYEFEGERHMDKPLVRYKAWPASDPSMERIDLCEKEPE